jgi:Rhodopirellula transposase DDE domain
VIWTLSLTSASLRDLERELGALGFRCRKDAVAPMLREAGYSLQGMSRVLEASTTSPRTGASS